MPDPDLRELRDHTGSTDQLDVSGERKNKRQNGGRNPAGNIKHVPYVAFYNKTVK
jgi:hypothetical protein